MSYVSLLEGCSGPVLFLIMVILIFILSRGADILVEEAAALSIRLRISRLIVGLVFVSIGTTLPEAAVSVFAALGGNPEIALGNAVGSVICNTGLILGLITLLAPISLENLSIKRQGWFQCGAGILLVASCIPFFQTDHFFETRVWLPRQMGMVFLVLLFFYFLVSIYWFRDKHHDLNNGDDQTNNTPIALVLGRIIVGSVMVVSASHFLVPGVEAAAVRMNIPRGFVSATMVAFGTSLPELVTSIKAVQKNMGELALGNIIGANILNVLFVAGFSASITKGGLAAPGHFSKVLFPAMMATLIIFGLGMHLSGRVFKKSYSVMLLSIYALVILSNFLGMAA
ncbi:MAG: sodium:calcium antiporter [Desulfobacteraceae bacterium]